MGIVVYAADGSNYSGAFTYNNGSAGVGATLTTTATTPLAVDGTIPGLGQVVLFFGLVDSKQNGVYTVTYYVFGGGVATVFTRTASFNTPTLMNAAGLIDVWTGSANWGKQYLLTSNVSSIGSDVITFSQYYLNVIFPEISGTLSGAQSVLTGVTNGSNATAGIVGERLMASKAFTSPMNFTSLAAADIISLSLTAGDWEVCGNAGFKPNGVTTENYTQGWCSTTSATQGAIETFNGSSSTAPGTSVITYNTPSIQVNVSSTTTVYLSGLCSFSGGGPMQGYGQIWARRVR